MDTQGSADVIDVCAMYAKRRQAAWAGLLAAYERYGQAVSLDEDNEGSRRYFYGYLDCYATMTGQDQETVHEAVQDAAVAAAEVAAQHGE